MASVVGVCVTATVVVALRVAMLYAAAVAAGNFQFLFLSLPICFFIKQA